MQYNQQRILLRVKSGSHGPPLSITIVQSLPSRSVVTVCLSAEVTSYRCLKLLTNSNDPSSKRSAIFKTSFHVLFELLATLLHQPA